MSKKVRNFIFGTNIGETYKPTLNAYTYQHLRPNLFQKSTQQSKMNKLSENFSKPKSDSIRFATNKINIPNEGLLIEK